MISYLVGGDYHGYTVKPVRMKVLFIKLRACISLRISNPTNTELQSTEIHLLYNKLIFKYSDNDHKHVHLQQLKPIGPPYEYERTK